MSLIIGIYNSVKHTKDKLEDLKLQNEAINEVKYKKQEQLYKTQNELYHWKGYSNMGGMAGAGAKIMASLVNPALGNAFDSTYYGVQIYSNFQDGNISENNGQIERVRNLLEKVNSGKSQLENIEKTLLESTRRIIETLGRNYNTAPAA